MLCVWTRLIVSPIFVARYISSSCGCSAQSVMFSSFLSSLQPCYLLFGASFNKCCSLSDYNFSFWCISDNPLITFHIQPKFLPLLCRLIYNVLCLHVRKFYIQRLVSNLNPACAWSIARMEFCCLIWHTIYVEDM